MLYIQYVSSNMHVMMFHVMLCLLCASCFPSCQHLILVYIMHVISISMMSARLILPLHTNTFYMHRCRTTASKHIYMPAISPMHCCRMNATKCIYTPVILPLMHCQCIDTPMHRICMAAAKFRTEPPFATTLPYVMYVRVMHIISIVFLM